MDTIRIKGLKVEAVIGVHAWERKVPRTLLIDLELATDSARAASKDRLEDALDYDAVSAAVTGHAAASKLNLVETLAEQLAALLRERFKVKWLSLTVHKPGAVAQAQDISVTIERGSRA